MMEVLRGADAHPSEPRPTVVTVGMFDGVHRGHKALFARVFDDARTLGAGSAVVTFDPHPLVVLAPSKAPCVLTTLDQRLGLFEQCGFDIALVLPFDDELARLDPEAFTRAALVDDLQVRKVIVGEDFRFGHKRAGDIGTLRALGERFGFEAEAIGLVGDEGEKISSTDIRRLLTERDVRAAEALLGHPFRLAGEVVHGDERGRTLGFPTANLAPDPRACLPGLGIYAGWWVSEGDRLPGVINVGVRPTFKTDDPPLAEIHLFDVTPDLYGAHGEIEFTAFLRPEEKFDGADALVAQMHEDAKQARDVLAG